MLNTQVIAAITCRGKSMLTQTEMFVVFVLDEIISQGSVKLTAGNSPTSNRYGLTPLKVPQ